MTAPSIFTNGAAMPRFPTLSVLLLSATALVALPYLTDLPVPPAYADGDKRDKGERREKGPSERADKGKAGKNGDGKEARGRGKGGKGGGSSGGGSSDGGSAGGGSSGGGSSGGGSSGGGSSGDGSSGGGSAGGGTSGGGGSSGGGAGGGSSDGAGGVSGGGGVIVDGSGPVRAPTDGPAASPRPLTLSGSNGSRQPAVIVQRLADPARLGPYADALLRVADARAALVAAEAELARLRGLSGSALIRAFPASAPSHDAAAHARDLRRVEGAVAEWQRLSALTEAELAEEFPPQQAGAPYDAAALAAAKRRALIRARDHDTLSNLPPERLAELYPAPRVASHDRTAHARAIDAAETEVEARTIAVTRAEAAAAETLYILTDGRGLTPREAAWVDAYLGR